MDQRQNADAAVEKQICAYRRRLREALAYSETEDGTRALRELQELVLEVSAWNPFFRQDDSTEADIQELVSDICRALQTASMSGALRTSAKTRLASMVTAVVAVGARLPRGAA